MTEDEAKAKVCCVDVGRRCTGSACMAWRWNTTGPVLGSNNRHLTGIQQGYGTTHWQEPDRPSYINDKWRWDAVRAAWVLANDEEPPTGFCGLAGKP